jgi:hypothetical protein
MTIRFGVDPGWRNLGYAIIETPEFPSSILEPFPEWKLKVVETGTQDPSKSPSAEIFVDYLMRDWFFKPVEAEALDQTLTIERYVTYQGVHTHESENILMLIGAMRLCYYSTYGNIATLVRAIDWKTKMTQTLNRLYGFENAGTSMDKNLSVQLAKFLVTNPEVIKTDHEADAICLAAYPYVLRLSERQSPKTQGSPSTIKGRVSLSFSRN